MQDLLTDPAKSETLAVRVPSEMARKLDEFKSKTGIPRSRLARAGIELALDKYSHLMADKSASR